MAAKNSSIDKMILRIAVSINKLLYNYIHFSVFSERANFFPGRSATRIFLSVADGIMDFLPSNAFFPPRDVENV